MQHKEEIFKGQITFSDLSYLAVVEKSVDAYAAFIPDVPEVYAFDKTLDGLKESLADALYVYLVDLQQESEPIPAAETQKYADKDIDIFETFWIEPAKPNPISFEIDKIIRQSGISYSEVSKRMKIPKSSMTRLTSPIYRGHTVDTLRKVAKALGYKMEVSFTPIK